ncbi:PIN domain-containing protein [Plantactinospora endophytica]|uniref:PIN domain-containing protein n=1 Tax=Plantactinospora endophytica TaxID=673535 RepID=A0ABQ4E491_9ACTN|nr:hypothetical protein [Plantactinospora endophytica]GIG89147.1 hypothetical protein Pen02_40830 [Plantactinospora endophytica]
MTAPLAAVVLDHSALLALGAGHRLLSGLVAAAHQDAGRHIYVPALCLAAASADRPALGEHVGALPAMEVVELGYPAAIAVGRLVAGALDWQAAHAVVVARPDAEWPTGRAVLTEHPDVYRRRGLTAVELPPPR